LPIPAASLPSNGRSGWPAKPHFTAAIAMTRHGTAGFYRVWRSHPFSVVVWGPEFPLPTPCLPRRPRLELAPTGARESHLMAPGEVAEWSNAPHSKFARGRTAPVLFCVEKSQIIGRFSLLAPPSCQAIPWRATEFGSKMVAGCSHSVRSRCRWYSPATDRSISKKGPMPPLPTAY
jgi:hypothetical protein